MVNHSNSLGKHQASERSCFKSECVGDTWGVSHKIFLWPQQIQTTHTGTYMHSNTHRHAWICPHSKNALRNLWVLNTSSSWPDFQLHLLSHPVNVCRCLDTFWSLSLEEGRYYNLVTKAQMLLASYSPSVRGRQLLQTMLVSASTVLQRNIQIILVGNLVLLSITPFI